MSEKPIWRYIDSGPGRAADNMAIDEQLLAQALLPGAVPVLRFYTWDPPAVSIGRFQRMETAVNSDACRRRGVDIVRRITGGRAVLHNSELTYSIVSPEGNDLFPPDVIGAYKVIAAGLLAGLRNLGIPAELVTRTNRHSALVKKDSRDPSCFSSPSWYEIVVGGRKIVGSAQRRVPGAFLQHGSILISHDPAFNAEVIPGGMLTEKVTSIEQELGQRITLDEIKAAFLAGFAEAWGITLQEKELPIMG